MLRVLVAILEVRVNVRDLNLLERFDLDLSHDR